MVIKNIRTIALLTFALAAFTACGNQNDERAANQAETGTDIDTDIEVDTAITQDPDTTTYHDMTL
ncbi:hypothetical protein [Pontibacter diazotrophicus]|uniref:hypothetical protein n=1 Tax=Pontibacter diazotrophicus TaxID=1400979 RepID=UPI0015F146D1|nr:hypothetical protein [Pontibacter diazotrophicus]